jgi:hypothetical protein
MPVTWRDDNRIGLRPQGVCKRQGSVQWRGWGEDPRMGRDPEKTTQDQLRETHGLGRSEGAFEPILIATVVRRDLTERVDKDVDVQEDQGCIPSMRSRRAALSSRSTPGIR